MRIAARIYAGALMQSGDRLSWRAAARLCDGSALTLCHDMDNCSELDTYRKILGGAGVRNSLKHRSASPSFTARPD